MVIEFHNLILWKSTLSNYVNFDKQNLQVNTAFIFAFKSDPSQQQTADLLILLPKYSDNDIKVLLNIK